MPKVFLNEKDKLNDRLATWIYGQMKTKGITQKQLAGELQMTQQALSYKLKAKQFSYADFITIVDVFAPDLEVLAWLTGRKGTYE